MVAKAAREPLREVTLFIEGGGDSDPQHRAFRQNFHKLLSKAGFEGRKPHIAVCGGRGSAYDDFRNYPGVRPVGYGILLVDSETPVDEKNNSLPWEHLKLRKDGDWSQPAGTENEQCHLMVQCMEAWFIADSKALKTFYGSHFKENKLPKRQDVESIPKQSLFDTLEAATKECRTKGCYSKGKHSFDLIGLINPAEIRRLSPWAERFFSTLTAVMARYR